MKLVTTKAVDKPPRCPRCGRQHQKWYRYAECRFKALWAAGSGPWASFSDCPRGRTIQLYDTREEAERAKEFIDKWMCGGLCCRAHRVVYIGATGL